MGEFKKIFKLIITWVAIAILFLCIVDFIFYTFQPKDITEFQNQYNEYAKIRGLKPLRLKYMKMIPFDIKNVREYGRPTLYGNSNKRPILIFGCSYMQGSGLKDNQTLSYKLYKLTNRTTYNKAIGGSGSQNMLNILQHEDFYKDVPDAEYIFYTFIWDHLQRLYGYYLSPYDNKLNLRYDFRNGKLEEIKPAFLPFYSLYSVKRIQDYIKYTRSINDEEAFKLYTAIMVESKKLTDKHYPNSKFVIVLYKDGGRVIFDDRQIKTLESKGFKVINAEKLVGHELTSSKYRIEDKEHPSEAAWNEVAPKLAKELNL